MKSKLLVVIGGPTAVGKTAFAIAVARHFNTEIISADSRQVYKELSIGVARPSITELNSVKHHFVASHSIHDGLNAGEYAKEANTVLEALFKQKDLLIMVGGTGLYIKAATQGLDHLPTANTQLREQLKKRYLEEGITALQQEYASLLSKPKLKDFENPQRLIRAIEIARGNTEDNMNHTPIPYSSLYFYLDSDRTMLYQRINARVDKMIEEGIIEEAKSVYPYKSLNALKTVGYKELFDFFDGNATEEEAIERIKQHSRNYAKRQITWFKNQGYQLLTGSSEEKINQIVDAIALQNLD